MIGEEARETMAAADAATLDCVFCTCAGRRWGVRLSDIGRVIARMDAPPVAIPHSPPWAVGFFRQGAEFVTLIDTARFLGDDASLPERWRRDDAILLCSVGDATLGLYVAALSMVATIVPQELVTGADQWATDPPYMLGRYYPEGERVAAAEGAVHFLNVRGIAADCLRTLEGEDADAAD